MPKFTAALAAALLLTACSGKSAAPVHSPTALTGALTQGLIAYVADGGVGVLDPATGKPTIVAPLQPGTFRVAGPVWAPAPNVDHPVLYFTVHDDRPAERRTTAGVVPYDWLFRVDPFAGTIEPIAASQDSQSNGPIGLVANAHYLALTVGCCTTYEVDALDLTQTAGPLKVLSKPPSQAAFFTEGAVPGSSGPPAVSGEIQVYDAAAADGTAPAKKYLAGANVAGVAWSGPIGDRTYAMVKPSSGPQAMVDALLTATSLPAQADTPANRPLTKVYLWRFDSTKTSPVESITDATPTVLATYPPLNAGVLFHHWGPIESWALLGGCYRYRVLITGSVTPTATTFGLGGNTLCSAKPSPTPSATASPSHSP